MIKDLSDVDQWHYVLTKSNRADYSSREIDPTKLTKVKMSFQGSRFLWKSESLWHLQSNVLMYCNDAQDPELKKEILVNAITMYTDLLGKTSKWNKVRRVMQQC